MSVLQKKSANQTQKSFSTYSREDRLNYITQQTGLSNKSIEGALTEPSEDMSLANTLIEAPLGYFALPLGLVKSLTINGKNYCIPLATEETSVIAAMNKTAAWVEKSGNLKAWTEGCAIIGQIQFAKLKSPTAFSETITQYKDHWINLSNQGPSASLFKRGGGVLDIQTRLLPRQKDKGTMAVLHVHLDPCEAMGANQVTQVCEFLQPFIEEKTDEEVTLCILSNLTDTKLTKAQLTLNNIDPDLGDKIEEASHFAACDPHRAATHNKGIMNGIDALLIATGNDWRAVEAGLHSYAATKSTNTYSPLSTWKMEGKNLIGTFEGPISVGVVGGATKAHPTAQFTLKCLQNPSANELSQIVASVGLVQNLGALRALVSDGIMKGHMTLHIKNILHNLQATPTQKHLIEIKLKQKLETQKYISDSDAIHILRGL